MDASRDIRLLLSDVDGTLVTNDKVLTPAAIAAARALRAAGIDLTRRSGFSIAMGNASDAVKSQAQAVTASNQDDGWAHAVRTYVLPAGAGD